MKVKVVSRILEERQIAERIETVFKTRGYSRELMGAPGAGKTTLLERTI